MTDKVDYEARTQRLSEAAERKDWFRADKGKYRIKFLSEGTPYTQEWDGETVNKLRFDVEVGGEELSLGVSEGRTSASFYGQLMLIATKLKPYNQMEGKEITLLVTTDGTKKTYTVLEAVELDTDTSKPKVEEVKV